MERYLDHNDDKLQNYITIGDLAEEWRDKVNKIGFQFHTPFVKGDPLVPLIWRSGQGLCKHCFFRKSNCRGHILVIFASMQLQILLISIRSTDEQFCRMGSLAWLGYLSYTQVVESSNLSPSIIYYSESFLAISSSREVPENSAPDSRHEERDARLIINLADYLP